MASDWRNLFICMSLCFHASRLPSVDNCPFVSLKISAFLRKDLFSRRKAELLQFVVIFSIYPLTKVITYQSWLFPVLAVQPLYNVCGIHDSSNILRKLEKGTDILPVFLPAIDRIGIFLSPSFFDKF